MYNNYDVILGLPFALYDVRISGNMYKVFDLLLCRTLFRAHSSVTLGKNYLQYITSFRPIQAEVVCYP